MSKRKVTKKLKDKRLSKRKFIKSLVENRPIASYNSVLGMYQCHCGNCKAELYAWQLPRHLEKEHSNCIPLAAKGWRKNIIPDWKREYEDEYLANLEKGFEWEDPAIDDKPFPKEIEEQAEKTKNEELKANRDR